MAKANTGFKKSSSSSNRDVEFKTVNEERHTFGTNNVMFVSTNQAIPQNGTPTDFVQVRRGWYGDDDKLNTKAFVSMPNDPELLRFIAENLNDIADSIE